MSPSRLAPTLPPRCTLANYHDAADAQAVVDLLDLYARDPMGGGHALSDWAREHLVAELARRPQAFSVLARIGETAVGLINCIEGFSTFACQPLINVHDVVVHPQWRGRGVAAAMLACVEVEAQRRGACKLTLEVLEGNRSAWTLYQRVGFAPYALDPAMGDARFLQKWLTG